MFFFRMVVFLSSCDNGLDFDILYNIYRAMAKNGSTRCFFGQKRVYLKTIATESVVDRI